MIKMNFNKLKIEIKYKFKKSIAVRYDAYYIYSKLLRLTNIKIKYRVINSIQKKDYNQNMLSGLHSGKIGDIIYALPTIKKLKIKHLLINLSKFLGTDIETAKALIPLLIEQDYIKKVSIVHINQCLLPEYLNENQIGVNYNLDKFRNERKIFENHLIFSHTNPFKVKIDPNEKWLKIRNKKNRYGNYILINFTDRYRSKTQEFWQDLLKNSPIKIIGIGLPNEFKNMNKITNRLITCNNFLEMAELIKNSKLFIGNQSSAFAIAEGLKVNRILEQSKDILNVYPLGKKGWIINKLNKNEFKKIIKSV